MENTEIEELIKKFGEDNRRLIEDSINWLNETEPSWQLKRKINKEKFIKGLISKKAPNTESL